MYIYEGKKDLKIKKGNDILKTLYNEKKKDLNMKKARVSWWKVDDILNKLISYLEKEKKMKTKKKNRLHFKKWFIYKKNIENESRLFFKTSIVYL